jgi:hypothetical protein
VVTKPRRGPLFAKKRAKIPYFEKRKENGFASPLAFEYTIKQLLNSVFADIENYQGLGLCYPCTSGFGGKLKLRP